LLALLPGQNDEAHKYRWTIFRWVQAAHSLTYRDYAGCYGKKILADYQRETGTSVTPEAYEELIYRGILTEDEAQMVLKTRGLAPYDPPLIWAYNLLNEIERDFPEQGKATAAFAFNLDRVRSEIQKMRSTDATCRGLDYIPIPLPYTQILAFAVYSYFVVALFGRQFAAEEDLDLDDRIKTWGIASSDDYKIPVLTLIELAFYTGWLKTMSMLFDPMAVSSYAYNLPEIEDGIIGRAMTIFRVTQDAMMPPLDDKMCGFTLQRFQEGSNSTMPSHFVSCESSPTAPRIPQT